jgi:hypothetical protein
MKFIFESLFFWELWLLQEIPRNFAIIQLFVCLLTIFNAPTPILNDILCLDVARLLLPCRCDG